MIYSSLCLLGQTMSKKARMTVSIDPELHDRLVERAKKEGRTAGNLASFLLSTAIEEMDKRGKS
jgi:predicted HicB family RNase H-like nuclease